MRAYRSVLSLAAALGAAASPAAAQAGPADRSEPATAPIAVFTASLYNAQANLREATDSARAVLATEVIRSRLRERLGEQVLPYATVDSAADAPSSRELAGGVPCNLRVACARAVGRGLGARWIVLTKVSKTSNLIWLLSAQLLHADTGKIVLDDSTELKGDPAVMVRVGARIFADRVVRTVQHGGRTTDFPQDEAAAAR